MTRGFRWMLVCTCLSVAGCVYFNTFFHAKQSYKEAEKMRLRANQEVAKGGVATKYNEAIKKASKVLQNHPKSKYADDATMLIGKSFYYMGDYARAREKFVELKGLRKIVVGPDVEAGNLIASRVLGRKQEHRGIYLVLSSPLWVLLFNKK